MARDTPVKSCTAAPGHVRAMSLYVLRTSGSPIFDLASLFCTQRASHGGHVARNSARMTAHMFVMVLCSWSLWQYRVQLRAPDLRSSRRRHAMPASRARDGSIA